MFGYTFEYSGETDTFHVFTENQTRLFKSNFTAPFNSGFKYTPCEGAILETLNIYNYQFLFDDIFGNILYDFINKTEFPAAMDEIMPFKKRIQGRFEKELDKIHTSALERKQSVTERQRDRDRESSDRECTLLLRKAAMARKR